MLFYCKSSASLYALSTNDKSTSGSSQHNDVHTDQTSQPPDPPHHNLIIAVVNINRFFREYRYSWISSFHEYRYTWISKSAAHVNAYSGPQCLSTALSATGGWVSVPIPDQALFNILIFKYWIVFMRSKCIFRDTYTAVQLLLVYMHVAVHTCRASSHSNTWLVRAADSQLQRQL
eukprot:jgi/Botrbrau1/11626/Bobra.0209s0017.1